MSRGFSSGHFLEYNIDAWCPPLVSILILHINPDGEDGDVLRDLGGEGITISPGSGVEE